MFQFKMHDSLAFSHRFSTTVKVQAVLYLILLGALVAIVYYPTLDAPFVFDDFPNIVENPAVHPEKISDFLQITHSEYSRTRPLALFSFAVNYWFGGLDVYGYHVANIVLHITNAMLLYGIFASFPAKTAAPTPDPDRIRHQHVVAFWAAALWALNPVQTHAVTYIVQRMTSMAALFYLAGILIYLTWRQRRIRTTLALVLLSLSFICGMASKEIVVTLPATLILLEYLFYARKINKPIMIGTALYVLLIIAGMLFYLKGTFPEWSTVYPNRNFSPLERVMTEWRVIWHYLGIYAFPYPPRLHLAYDPVISKSLLTPWTTLPGLLAIVAALIVACLARKSKPLLAFGVFYYFLTLVLESTFLNLEIAFIHRLFLPSAFLIFPFLVSVPQKYTKKISFVILMIIGLWSFWTIDRNVEWTTPEKFWAQDQDRGAAAARALNNKAAALIDSGKFQEALLILDQGLAAAPVPNGRILLLYNKGSVLHYLEKYEESLATFETIAKEYGAFKNTYLLIGQNLIQLQRLEQAELLAQKMLQNESVKFEGRILEANILAKYGKTEETEKLLIRSIDEIDARKTEELMKLKMELARHYLNTDNPGKAYVIYLELVEIYPHNYFAWSQLYQMVLAGGDMEKAYKIRVFLESKGVL